MKKNISNNSNCKIDDHSIDIHCPINVYPSARHRDLEKSYSYENGRTFKQVLEDVSRGADSLDDKPDSGAYSINTPELAENIDMDIPVTLYFSKRIYGCPANLQRFVDRLGGILGVAIDEKSDSVDTDIPTGNQPSDTAVVSPTTAPTSDLSQ